MSSLKAAYLNELYKISKRKKIVVAAILSVAAIGIAGLIVSSLKNFAGINVVGSSEFAILVLSVLNYTLLPLFTAFICIDMFSSEFVEQTIKMTLTRPVSRFLVYLSKVLAAATFILANLLFVMLLSLILSVMIGGSQLSLSDVIGAYLSSFFPLMVLALMVMFIANLTRGTVSAFMLSVLVYIVFLGLGFFWPNAESFFFTSTLDWYILFTGTFVNVQKIFRLSLILLGYGIALFSAGYALFDRRQI